MAPGDERDVRDDSAWSTLFGATNVAARPYAVAVADEAVCVAGDFIGPMAGLPEGTFNRVAWWDGRGWQQMGEGVDAPARAVVIVGQEVFVGGELSVAGGVAANRLARWDGNRWFPVAGGVTHSTQPMLAAVRGLACDGRRLFVTGLFDRVGVGDGVVPANGFAALDLATGEWQAFGSGLTFQGGPAEGNALALWRNRVYVGGSFDAAGDVVTSSLAALEPDTGRWFGFGSGMRNGDFAGVVDALAVDEDAGTVYVGGSFTAADTVPTSGVASLAGDAFGSLGAFTLHGDASTARVTALACSQGRLHAGGHFTVAGDVAASHWAVHDGTSWALPGEGVDNTVQALAAHPDGVVVAGDFEYSGDVRVTHAAIWTGASWRSFGQGLSYDPYGDGNVFAVVPSDGRMHVGGSFDQAGALRVGSVAEWTDAGWTAMAGGLREVGVLAKVFAMARIGTDLYVTGTFSSAGGAAAGGIARWDGVAWSPLGGGIRGTGYALAVLGGRLYVGGAFTAAGDTAANGVACWDPETSRWSALGNAPQYDDAVLSLAVVADRYLVIGGQYGALRSGNVDLLRNLNALAVFDTQAATVPDQPLSGYGFPAGVQRASGPGRIRAMQVLGGELFVGGHFDTAGVQLLTDPPDFGFAAGNLAAWRFAGDGGWSSPGGTDEQVTALTTLDGNRLVVGGYFGSAGPAAASGVAEYDPATGTWASYGTGIGAGERGVRHVEAVAQSPEHGLWVGGTFLTAGARPSGSLALWRGTIGRVP